MLRVKADQAQQMRRHSASRACPAHGTGQGRLRPPQLGPAHVTGHGQLPSFLGARASKHHLRCGFFFSRPSDACRQASQTDCRNSIFCSCLFPACRLDLETLFCSRDYGAHRPASITQRTVPKLLSHGRLAVLQIVTLACPQPSLNCICPFGLAYPHDIV